MPNSVSWRTVAYFCSPSPQSLGGVGKSARGGMAYTCAGSALPPRRLTVSRHIRVLAVVVTFLSLLGCNYLIQKAPEPQKPAKEVPAMQKAKAFHVPGVK
jgi:hypothetical protein